MDQTPTLALGIRRVLSLSCPCFINIIILRGVILPPLLVTYTRYSGLRWARRVSGVSRKEGFVTLAAYPLGVLPRVRHFYSQLGHSVSRCFSHVSGSVIYYLHSSTLACRNPRA